ncbi:metallophosphoesterase [Niastella caeni]|uniref:Metallophosphoesterase n=1 Tax=Niastella caeni TaxID=2569763 RepID=A0A4V4H1A6_9BACT|nr:metallophosphoesterase [Niastella caeni]THU39706.1 metallophosphoesterase [Niastella caeni]
MDRRSFLKNSAPVLLLFTNGELLYRSALSLTSDRVKVKFRFAVASDGHFGQPKTTWDTDYGNIVQHINQQRRLKACIINGDIIHDDPAMLPLAKQHLDKLKMPYYVTQGNHDRVDEELWKKTWNMPLNHSFVVDDQVFLLATTSNIKGEYICPDLDWMRAQLEKYKQAPNVFIAIHITPVKWTDNGVDCPEFINLLKDYKNVRAVFNGHDHDQDDMKEREGIPFLFDSHIGGNWGTNYKGFRMVEVMSDNTVATYILNPGTKLNEHTLPERQVAVKS